MRGMLYIVLLAAMTTAQLTTDPAYTGSGKYVTLWDDPGSLDEEVYKAFSKTWAVSVFGSNSDTTTYAWIRTNLDNLPKDYVTYNNTITMGPTTIFHSSVGLYTRISANLTTLSPKTFWEIHCSFGGTTTAACTTTATSIRTAKFERVINTDTFTTVRKGTNEIVNRIATMTDSSSVYSVTSLQITPTPTVLQTAINTAANPSTSSVSARETVTQSISSAAGDIREQCLNVVFAFAALVITFALS